MWGCVDGCECACGGVWMGVSMHMGMGVSVHVGVNSRKLCCLSDYLFVHVLCGGCVRVCL